MISTDYTARTHYQQGESAKSVAAIGGSGPTVIKIPKGYKILQINSDQDLAVEVDYDQAPATPVTGSWYLKSGISELVVDNELDATIYLCSRSTGATISYSFAK